MGLFDSITGGPRMTDPVNGVARVVAVSSYLPGSVTQNCRMNLVVQGEGVPPTAVEHSAVVHNQRWPAPGMTLPAMVDRADPRRVKINWKAVQPAREQARDSAEALAAAMRGDSGAPPGGQGGFPAAEVMNLTGRDLSQLTEEQRTKLRMLGIDPASLAAAQGVPAPTGPPEPAPIDGGDLADQLAQLAALHGAGSLTDEEFAAAKRRLLDR